MYDDVLFENKETKTWWLKVRSMIDSMSTIDSNPLLLFARGFIYMELYWLHNEKGLNENRKRLIEILGSINFDRWNIIGSEDRLKIKSFIQNTNWKCTDPSKVILNKVETLKNMMN